MKTLILNKNLILFAVVLIILSSCTPADNREFERGLEVFIICVLQIINMIVFGILSLVFCIMSSNNPKPIFKVLGWIFLSFFSICFIAGIIMLSNSNPREFSVYFIFLIEMTMVVVSFIFVLRKPKASSAANNKDVYLDQIIDEKDEVV